MVMLLMAPSVYGIGLTTWKSLSIHPAAVGRRCSSRVHGQGSHPHAWQGPEPSQAHPRQPAALTMSLTVPSVVGSMAQPPSFPPAASKSSVIAGLAATTWLVWRPR